MNSLTCNNIFQPDKYIIQCKLSTKVCSCDKLRFCFDWYGTTRAVRKVRVASIRIEYVML